MKRLLSSLLALVFVVGVCVSAPITANAETAETKEYTLEGTVILQYIEGSGECFVKKWLGTDMNLTLNGSIPIGNVSYEIIGVLSKAFTDCTNLETITLKQNIKIVETGAFAENVIVICDTPEQLTTKPADVIFHRSIDGNVHNISSYKIANDEIVGVCTCGVDSGVFATIEYSQLNEAGWAHSAFVNPADGVSVSLNENDGFTGTALEITQDDVTGEKGITIYLKPSENENVVEVSGDLSARLDSTAPTGKIRLDENNYWTTEGETNFELFFKTGKILTVTADDNGSGVKSVAYYISGIQIDDVETIGDWSVINADADIPLNTDSKNIVYLKITDNADNVTYINSKGIILYRDSVSENQTIEYTYNENLDKEISLTFNGNTINSVKCNEVQLDSDDYTVDTDNNKITLNASYLNTLSVGEYNYIASYNPQGEIYVEAGDNEEPATTEFAVKVSKGASLIETAPTPVKNLVYTGEEQNLVRAGTATNGTIEYRLGETENAKWNTTVPVATDAGTYKVYYRVVGNENYNDVETSGPVTVIIGQKVVTNEMVTLSENVTYNGAEQKPTVTVDGLTLDTDYIVEFKRGETAIDDFTNAGKITVVVTGKGNYQGTIETSYVIEQATVSISEINVSDRVYNGKTDVKILGADVTGIADVDGGKVSIDLGGVQANVRNSFAGSDKTVIFTGSPVLTGEKSSNYKLSGNIPETTVTISKKSVTITAKDVTVVVKSENPTITEYKVEGLLDGETLESVTLIAKDFESTASVADYEIEVSEAFIKNASSKDVTDNYSIDYVAGKLSVVECTEHKGGTATCKLQAVCTVCKKPYGEVDPDAHNPGEWEQKTPATCQAEGVMVKKCTECKKELETETIKVLPHALGGWILETAPTCVDNGKMHRSCINENCNYKEDAEITATGVHTPGEWEEKTPASCENNGVKVRKCTVCQFECETGVITAEHSLGEWQTTKNPTCKEEGSRERKCIVENCEYKEIESIDKLSHTESSWNFVKDSTCSEEGKLEKICTVCKEVIETATIPEKDHDFTEWKETKAPGCEDVGEEKRICENCGETETREVEVLGHDFSEEFTIDAEPTCTESGSKSKHCSRCEEKSEVTVIDALGHDYENVDFTIDVEPTCTEAGSKSKHCTRCEEKSEITVVEATGHIDFVFETIKEATCTTAGSMLKKCKCGEELEIIVTSPKEHILSDWIIDKEATCTTAGSKHKECTLCKAVLESGVIDILGHKYGEWTVTKDSTCFEDGSKYRICSVCEDKETVVIEKIAHKNAEIKEQKDATCLENGYSGDLYCPDCKEILEKGEVLKATGHTVSDWITDKEPTFTEGGTQHKECTVCKEELQTAIIEKLTLDIPKVTIENDAKGVKVTWTQDEDAAGYTIYSSQYNAKTKTWSKWKNRGTLNADSSSWVDKKVQKDVKYKYTVRAVNGKFKSDYKGSNSITFITAPKATVTISTTGLIVKWNKIDGADSYVVYRSEKTGSKWTKWTALGTTGEAKNSWLDDKIVSGVTYRYAIRAVDNKIKSGYVATDGMIFLEQPTLTISNTAAGITGTWEKVDGAKGYTIYRSELVNGKWTKWVNLGTTKETAKSFTDKTVKSGNQYKYTLRAVNGKVKSTYKDSNILMYIAAPVLKIKNEANAVSGSWNQVKGAKGYIIYRSELKDGKWTKWVNLGTTKETAKTFTDKTVKSGVTYKYTVRAINGKYKSSYIDSNSLVFLSVPTVKIANDTTGVKVSWNKITGATSYIVYRRELKSDKWTKWENLGNVEKKSFVDSTAVSNTKYQYTVRAVNGASKSVYKESQTLHYIAVPVVTLNGDETGIKVSWTKVDGAKNYIVYRSVLGEDGKWSSWQNMDTVKGTKSSWIDKSAVEDVVYSYTVRAVNGKIKSAYIASEPLMIESEKEPETEQN